MTDTRPTPELYQPAAQAPRRAVLRALALGLTAGLAPRARAAAERFPDRVTLLVAGPANGRLDQWGVQIATALGRFLPPNVRIQRVAAGGADGVTAANQFEARVVPDGATLLLVPGEAALAWQTGDPRAQFDTAHWLPVMAGVSSGVLVSRLPAASLRPGMPLRLAAAGPAGPDLPALLAVTLLGLNLVPVFGIQGPVAACEALASGSVDAVFIRGADVAIDVAAARAVGATPLCVMGVPRASGALDGDPRFPDVPDLPDLAALLRGMAPSGPLFAAWRATATAVQLEFALVLPPLTPATLLAQWREAALHATAAVQDDNTGVRAFAAPRVSAVTSAVVADAAALTELRRWLARRFSWRPA
jgi:hypothetical protein